MVYSGLLNNYFEDFANIISAVEAVIFASEEPVSFERLFEAFNIRGGAYPGNNPEDIRNGESNYIDKDIIDNENISINNKKRHIRNKNGKGNADNENKAKKEIILKALESIKKEFNEKSTHGIYLSVNDNGISFKTKPEYFDVISGSLKIKPIKFAPSQLETLSIIAYKQPVTKNEIDAIRGVDSGSTVKFLLEKNLIRVAGRKEIVGRPLIYKTADYFLEVFNLKNVNDLPSVKEMEEVFKKSGAEAAAKNEEDGNTLFGSGEDQ